MSEQKSLPGYTGSKIWLISLQSNSLGRDSVRPKTTKTLISSYKGGDDEILFPVGYLIEHSGEPNSFTDHGGFYEGSNLVPRAIYDGIEISHLEGELLTLADASFTDKSQREAFKSLLKQTLWKFNSRQEDRVEAIFKASK